MTWWSIGELAAEVGVAASTLRYYDELGLLVPASRDGGRRWYGPEERRRLATIRVCQEAGFTLAEVRSMLDGDVGWRALTVEKLAEVEGRLAELARARDLLREALQCDCRSIQGCEAIDVRLEAPGAHAGARSPR